MAEYNGIHENVIRKDLGMELIEGWEFGNQNCYTWSARSTR
jgi:hypothetical protein